MRAALYTRVSTTDQNAELQIRDLQAYANRQGWYVAEAYKDVMSSATSHPSLTRLLADAPAGKFDCVLRWKLDRFGRSLVDCSSGIRELEAPKLDSSAFQKG